MKRPYTSDTEENAEQLSSEDQFLKEDAARRVNHVAGLMDEAFRLPGTRFRFGWDGILGLIPGVGDFATTMASFYIVVEAIAAGAPPAILIRMLANVAIDSAVSIVPIFGDLADFAWKANRRNSRLLLQYLRSPERTARRSKAWITTGIILLTAFFAATLYVAWLFAFFVFNWIRTQI